MLTTLPSEARLTIDPPRMTDNLVGMVRGIFAIFSAELDGELPEGLDEDEFLAISAVAFKNYVYEPEYNELSHRPRAYSKLGEFVCNYGPFESISYYTGWDVKEFDGVSTEDFWKLVRFEIASGRPVVSLSLGGPLEPVLVVGYDFEPRKQTLDVVRPGKPEASTVDVTGMTDFQPEAESFTNWLLIARPSESPEWASSHTRQRLRVLRWAARHAKNRKEFSQETRENYAPGLRGFESFLDQLDRLGDEDVDRWDADDPVTGFVRGHVEGLSLARRAASRRLPIWSADLLSDSELEIEARKEVEEELERAADCYETVSEKLSEWLDGWSGQALSTDDVQELWRQYERAFEAEKEAVEALAEAVKRLPRGF